MKKYKKRLDLVQTEYENLKISRESEIRTLESEKYDLLFKLDEQEKKADMADENKTAWIERYES